MQTHISLLPTGRY